MAIFVILVMWLSITNSLSCLVHLLLMQFFNLIHVDLWGLYRTKAITCASYFLTMVDDYSRVTWTHLFSNKEHVKGVLVNFIAHVEAHFNTRVKTLRSDNETGVVQEECGRILLEKVSHTREVLQVCRNRTLEWKENIGFCLKQQDLRKYRLDCQGICRVSAF